MYIIHTRGKKKQFDAVKTCSMCDTRSDITTHVFIENVHLTLESPFLSYLFDIFKSLMFLDIERHSYFWNFYEPLPCQDV